MTTSRLLLGLVLLLAAIVENSQAGGGLTIQDEYYLVGLRDLYRFGNLTVGQQPPYAVLAVDYAGYSMDGHFVFPDQRDRPVMPREELWPCKGNYTWPIDAETKVIGAQDFNEDGLLTYHTLLRKYKKLLSRRPQQTYVHVFFSHLPSPATINAFVKFARSSTTKFSLGYYRDAPPINGRDLSQDLLTTAVQLTKDSPNLFFGRIDGKNSSVENLFRPRLEGCTLFTPSIVHHGYPEPEVFLAKRRISSVQFASSAIGLLVMKSIYRVKYYNSAAYYCRGEGSQLATVEQMKRSARAGYKYPCSWLVDGTSRQTLHPSTNHIEVGRCVPTDHEAYVLCSGTTADVVLENREETGPSNNIVGEGNEVCQSRHGTYVAGENQLKQAISVGFYSEECGLVSNGKIYKVIKSRTNDTSLALFECRSGDTFGFFCSLQKPEVWRQPREKLGAKFATHAGANMACKEVNAHLASSNQLHSAWERGLDYCDCGYLSDGQVVFPIKYPRAGCSIHRAAGVRSCPGRPRSWRRDGWAAYCSNAKLPILTEEHPTNDWATDMVRCKVGGRGMATFDIMVQAHRLGYRSTNCVQLASGESYVFGQRIRNCNSPTVFHCTRFQLPVFHVNNTESGRSYDFANEEEAERACQKLGTTLASHEMLNLAFELGYNECACGFVRGGGAHYPITKPREGCGEHRAPGLRDCPHPRDWNRRGWDAYCVTLRT